MSDTHKELEKLKRGLRRAYQANNIKEAILFCNSIGALLSEIGEYEQSLRYHKEELQLCDSLQDQLGLAVSHRKIGESLASLCQFNEALKHQQKYLELAQDLNNMKEIQRAHTTIGRVWYMRMKSSDEGDLKHALKSARDAFLAGLSCCDELEDQECVGKKELSEMKAGLYLNLGLLAEEENDYRTAEYYYEAATRIGKEANAHSLMWQSQLNLGDMLLRQGKHERAQATLKNSLQHGMAGNNKQHQAESLIQLAMLHIQQINFSLARQHLRAALKLDSLPGEDDRDTTMLHYKAVCKVIRLEKKVTQPSLGALDKMRVYEQMGDLCAHARIGFYAAAVHYYLQELTIATTHGVEPKEFSKILFSVAETLVDNEQYEEALKYYEKELDVCEQPNESAETLTNIARLHVSADHSPAIVLEAYDKATEMAKTAQNHTLQASLYNSTIEYLEARKGMEEELERVRSELQALLVSHPTAADQQSLTGMDSDTPLLNSNNMIDDLELSPTSDEDEEDDMVGVECVQPQTQRGMALRRKSKATKRNEKGETLLHVAVIDGNLARVQQLVNDGGADLTAQDYCGWTPLHEACNHGYLDIVECLVDAGAAINDQGGAHCNGISPLMDAACNSHLDIVTVLVDKGAQLGLKDANGMTALALVEQALSSSTSSRNEELVAIRDLLREEMIRRNLLTAQRSTRHTAASSHSSSKQTAFIVESSSEEDSPQHRPVAVISPIRRRTSHMVEQPNTALLSDSCVDECASQPQHPVVDDWLVDDMGGPPTKKRRHAVADSLVPARRVSSTQPSTSSCRPSSEGNVSGRRRPSNVTSASQQRSGSRANTIVIGEDLSGGEEMDTYNNEFLYTAENHSTVPEDNVVSLPPAFQQLSTVYSHPGQSIRVKVLIENDRYLIPCPRLLDSGNSTTVEWLSDKVTDRYYNQYGRRPILHLTTSEGALLYSPDSLFDVVKEGETVTAVVDRWENPPLGDYYDSVCSRMNCVCYKPVLELFKTNANPSTLDLSDTGLQPKHCPALFQSLVSQSSNLTTLLLSGNRLLDPAMEQLANAISRLSSLTTLDLSCTGITTRGLATLSRSTAQPLSGSLQRLVLCHNFFGDTCGSSFVSILARFSNILYLYLDGCGLTTYLLQPHTGFLDALKGLTGLQELSLSCNPIDFEGWQLILTATAGSRLCLLNLSSSIISSTCTVSCLAQFGSSLSWLSNLNLSCCNLGDNGLSQLTSALHMLTKLKELVLASNKFSYIGIQLLARCLQDCISLQVLDLSGNAAVGNHGCLAVLHCCVSPSSMKKLRMAACGLSSPLPSVFWSDSFCLEHLDLSDNNFSIEEKTKIGQWWCGVAVVHGKLLILNEK